MTTLFEELLRDSDPGREVADYDAHDRDQILTDVLAAKVPPRRAHRGRVLLAACAALVVAGLGYQSITASVGAAQAAEVLSQAATHVSDPLARASQYWQVTRVSTNLAQDESDRMYLVSRTDVDYVAVDGRRPSWFAHGASSVVRQVSGPDLPDPPVGGKGESWTTNLSPEQMPAWWSQPSPSWLASLPRETSRLRDRLYADTAGRGNNPDDEAFIYVADLLRTSVVPADLRAALFLVLKTIPGTVVKDAAVTLPDGRTGTAIGRNDIFGTKNDLVIDPGSGEVIGERSMYSPGLFGAGVTTMASVTRSLVDEIPAEVRATAVKQQCRVENDEVLCE